MAVVCLDTTMKNVFIFLILATTALVILNAQTVIVPGITSLTLGGSRTPGLTTSGQLTLPTFCGGIYTRKTADFTATPGGIFGVDTTSGSVTVTPPASPQDGCYFVIFDVARTWATHTPIVGSSADSFLWTEGLAAGPFEFTTETGPPGWAPMEIFVWYAPGNYWSIQY